MVLTMILLSNALLNSGPNEVDNRPPPSRISRFGFSIPGTGGAESGLKRAWNWASGT
jgi:hypothetical protein